MTTNQEKVKELIGEENYRKMISAGYMPIEIESLEVLLAHQKKLSHLEEAVHQLEGLHLDETREPKPVQEQLPDIDIDYKLTTPPKLVPPNYKWTKDIAYQILEDEAKSLNVYGVELYISPLSCQGVDGKASGEMGVSFLAKGNQKLIDSFKENNWSIHRWRVDDKEAPTGKVIRIQAKKTIKLRYEMGYEAK